MPHHLFHCHLQGFPRLIRSHTKLGPERRLLDLGPIPVTLLWLGAAVTTWPSRCSCIVPWKEVAWAAARARGRKLQKTERGGEEETPLLVKHFRRVHGPWPP
jgi:hypothetical protein